MKKFLLVLAVVSLMFYVGCDNVDITLDGTFTNQTNIITGKVADMDTVFGFVVLNWNLTTSPEGDSMIIKRGSTTDNMEYIQTVDIAQSGTVTDTISGISDTVYHYGLYLYSGTDEEEVYVYDVILLPTLTLTSPGDTIQGDTVKITFNALEDSATYFVDVYAMDSLSFNFDPTTESVFTDTISNGDIVDGAVSLDFIPETTDSIAIYNLKITAIKDLNTTTFFKPFVKINIGK